MTATTKRRLTILYAEDMEHYRLAVVHLLEKAGHTADSASDGMEAWGKVLDDIHRYDVIITDHDMPGLTGLELAELLRAANYRGRVIVFSALVKTEERLRYQSFGVQRIVMKSGDSAEIIRTVEQG